MSKFKIIFIFVLFVNLINYPAHAMQSDFENGRKSFKQGNYLLATQYFRRALRDNPGNVRYRYYLATVLLQAKQLKDSQAEFQRIIQIAPYTKEAQYSKIGLVKINDYLQNRLNPRWRPQNSNIVIGVTETKSKAKIGSNYIDKVTDKGNVYRWQTESMPIKVYIESNPKNVKHFSNDFIQITKNGVDAWQQATNNKVNFTYVADPFDANIKITWKDVFNKNLKGADSGTHFAAGITSPDVRGNELKEMSIVMTTTDPNGKPHTLENLQKVITHEAGHALGIMGHSENSNDIMYAYNDSADASISEDDINTITLLYELEPDVSNFSDIDNTKAKEIVNNILGNKDERIDREISSIRDELQDNPDSDINYVNLGNLYGDKGNFKKAIIEYKKALKINPDNATAYSNLGITCLKADKPYDALNYFNQAKKLEPDKPNNYLNIAIVSETINQIPNAIVSLEKYIKMKPGALNEPEVIELAKRLKINFKN